MKHGGAPGFLPDCLVPVIFTCLPPPSISLALDDLTKLKHLFLFHV